ncbi:P-loop containing nucleoside triphosphate hydrolase protein [Aspergillus novoparasiticus]|uniref:P-loop containing nucleoside triphosphate hydrolase protein n=1 Tax=Aspergillus novoparasiticus TaxID=986946 RepID=A0A5N6F9L1_9EURO|nr:P-loop containing nucleoside triphosphate hydrolase protein [Aspergillus novoparasiticus]
MFETIDSTNCASRTPARQQPMKVLVLGMARTGRTSLAAAFKKLGYCPYDFSDRAIKGHFPQWIEALRAKYLHQGATWGWEQFDNVTGDFDVSNVILDTPCCFFVDELVAAYSDAKIILSTRDPDKWLKSMQNTISAVMRFASWQVLRYMDPRGCGRWLEHSALTWRSFCCLEGDEKCQQAFIDHNNYVRTVVPKDRLLIYEVREGWKSLCEFLGDPEPDAPFPSCNSTSEFMKIYRYLWWVTVRRSIWNLLTATASLALFTPFPLDQVLAYMSQCICHAGIPLVDTPK